MVWFIVIGVIIIIFIMSRGSEVPKDKDDDIPNEIKNSAGYKVFMNIKYRLASSNDYDISYIIYKKRRKI